MNTIDTTILDGLIVGRIDPHIYAFTTNTVPNYLKVGDTYRPVNVRLNEWREHFPNLQHESNWEWTAKTKDGKYFRDFAVHYYLEHIKRYHRLQPNDIVDIPYYSKEFFENATPEDIDAAIIDIEQRASQVGSPDQFYSEDRLPEDIHFERKDTYDPRPNQDDTIKKFNEARAKGRRHLLMYAVMRFGKSFTSMCCATEMAAKVVLIVSAKADVRNEWKRTVESHVRFSDYVFVDSEVLAADINAISNHLQEGKCVAVFLTLQDLMGDNIKEKHADLFRNTIDLLIVDETHFGARAEEYGRILRKTNELTALQAKKEYRLSGENSIEDLENGLERIKELNVDTTLHLSGTPYRILMGSEFKPEDIIAFYQFTDIIDDKEKFDKKHGSNDDYKEWDNPYYGFPQMIRFAFNPNESARKLIEQLKEQGKSAQLNELFRPQSISKDNSAEKKHRHFIHEKEILDFLHVIDGSAEDENLLGFLNYDKLKEGKMCRHMVFVLPFCASCDAMAKLLSDNKDLFINLNEYEIVNISGIENDFASTEAIKQYIESLEKRGKKSITLTVNRMLTGSTVKHWDTMLFLKDVSSPQEYDQAIFRLQNQYVTKYKDEAGDEIKYNMKPQTLLVDFDPNRMFVMQEQKSKIYNVNVNESGNDELEERLRRELEISPIIVLNKGKMGEVVPTDIMNAVREYSANITVMDEACEIPTDFEILEDPNLWDMIKDLEPIDSKKGLEIKPNEGEGEDYDIDSDPDELFVSPADDVDDDNDNPKANRLEDDDKRDKRLAALFARVLFFALLTNDTVRSLQQVIEVIARDKTNQRIQRNVGLKFKQLRYLRKHIDPFVLSNLDYKISNTNDLLRDITHQPLERVESALKKFGRLSDSEIVTPASVADNVVALLPKDAMDNNAKVLDIASKQGEFACALYKYFGADKRNNIYALPTSSLTYEFTYKVFQLLDIPSSNIFSTFNSYDLIGENNEQYIQYLENMKFNAIVGNPPYQMRVDIKDTDNGQKRVSSIFQLFQQLSDQIGRYTSMIYPGGRWIHQFGKGMKQFGISQINNCNLSKLIYYPQSEEIFDNVGIADGLSIVLKDNNKLENGFEYSFIEDGERQTVFMDNPGDELIPLNPKDTSIIAAINKVVFEKDYSFLHNSVLSQKLFSIESDFVETNPQLVRPYSESSTFNPANEIKILTNDKAGKSGRAKWYIVNKDIITTGREYLDKWKVVVSSANAGGQKRSNQLEILDNYSAFGRVKVALKTFDTEEEARNFYKYVDSELVRFAFLLTDEALTSLAKKVPDLGNYRNDNGIIDYSKDINEQLYSLFAISEGEQEHIKAILNKRGHN